MKLFPIVALLALCRLSLETFAIPFAIFPRDVLCSRNKLKQTRTFELESPIFGYFKDNQKPTKLYYVNTNQEVVSLKFNDVVNKKFDTKLIDTTPKFIQFSKEKKKSICYNSPNKHMNGKAKKPIRPFKDICKVQVLTVGDVEITLFSPLYFDKSWCLSNFIYITESPTPSSTSQSPTPSNTSISPAPSSSSVKTPPPSSSGPANTPAPSSSTASPAPTTSSSSSNLNIFTAVLVLSQFCFALFLI